MSDRRPELILRLTHSLAGLPVGDPLPMRMCLAFVQVTRARGGSITLGYANTERTLLCATDDEAARYEDAQDVVREGPSLDAYRTGVIVSTGSLDEHRRRWPGLDAAVSPTPRGVRAVPIRPDSSIMGVLTVFDGAELESDATELQFLADAIGAGILGDLPAPDDESRLWGERDLVSQATGMVVAQLRIPPGDALAVLRAHAFARGVSAVDVSRRVVGRELDFSQREGGDDAP